MFRYLLDTNTVSDLMRNPQGRVRERIAAVGQDRVATSILVTAEIHYGIVRKESPRLARQAEIVLATLPALPFEAPADVFYADIRADLARRGLPIGANDLFIAAHALALDLTLVTANDREFRRVESLRVENWLS